MGPIPKTKENGMMYRVFKTKAGDTLKEAVVPSQLRKQILSLGHDIPLAGHLGIKKIERGCLEISFGQGFLKMQENTVNHVKIVSWKHPRYR